MANGREGFDPSLIPAPSPGGVWIQLDSLIGVKTWPFSKRLEEIVHFFCLQLYCILKGNVVLLQVRYIIFNIWALIQLCTYKRGEGVLNIRCSMCFLWNMLFLFEIQNFVQKYTSSLKNGVSFSRELKRNI